MGSSSHTSKIKRGKDAVALDIIAYGFCGIIALVCLVPFIMIVSGSFSSESAIIQNGFSLLPQDFSLEAYKTVFKDPMVVFRAYGTTIGLTIVGTVLGLLLQTMTAYVRLLWKRCLFPELSARRLRIGIDARVQCADYDEQRA